MTYYKPKEVDKLLSKNPKYKDKLYCRGFLITTKENFSLAKYPFYDLWRKIDLSNTYHLYVHKDAHIHTYSDENKDFFLIGHAYNPYTMQEREEDILFSLAKEMKKGESAFWNYESELTGVFCLGVIKNEKIMFCTDCTGMQMVFYSYENNSMMISSHSKLIADLCGFEQTKYIKKLISSRFYHYWGTFLPGDISPFAEVTRVVPNFSYVFNPEKGFSFKRFFPCDIIEEVDTTYVDEKLEEIAEIMRNNLSMIAKKWGNRAALSVTGGRDSTATLASAKNVYEKLKFFSYESQPSEAVDAEAAHKICQTLGLTHTIYDISENDSDFEDIEVLRVLMECNAGCIGPNNKNDVRKRAYFNNIDDFDIEVKSWVSELGRGEAQNKYGTLRWPKKPSPGYYRCMWKVIVNPILIVQSNRIFREYLKKYYNKDTSKFLPWMDYFYWEFSWSSGEGVFLTSEHRVSYDITIPYNNRKLLATIFTIPLELRINNRIPIELIKKNNPAIAETGILVKNVAHTNIWTFIIRTYLRIFSKWGLW